MLRDFKITLCHLPQTRNTVAMVSVATGGIASLFASYFVHACRYACTRAHMLYIYTHTCVGVYTYKYICLHTYRETDQREKRYEWHSQYLMHPCATIYEAFSKILSKHVLMAPCFEPQKKCLKQILCLGNWAIGGCCAALGHCDLGNFMETGEITIRVWPVVCCVCYY